MSPKGKFAAVVMGLLVFGTFFFAPVVPYSQDVSIPGNITYERSTCQSLVVGGFNGGTYTVTTATFACMKPNGSVPAAVVNGLASPSFRLLGSGVGPYPSSMVVHQGNRTAVVYFDGGRAARAEYVLSPDPVINPSGVLLLGNVGVRIAGFGLLNFTATIQNLGTSTLSSPVVVYIDSPGLDTNSTYGGITWFQPYPVGVCYIPLVQGVPPGRSCTVSHLVNLGTGGEKSITVEVRGAFQGPFGDTPFIYRQEFTMQIPAVGMGRGWVEEFVQEVNSARGPSPLAENASLDQFAAVRFMSASAHPDVSDSNYTADANAWFGTFAGGTSETLLFPAGYTPADLATFLQKSAPGHWTALSDTAFKEFGYFIGEAPYFQISANCPVAEVLGQGVNITQYFQSRGCAVTSVPGVIWLVIVLAP